MLIGGSLRTGNRTKNHDRSDAQHEPAAADCFRDGGPETGCRPLASLKATDGVKRTPECCSRASYVALWFKPPWTIKCCSGLLKSVGAMSIETGRSNTIPASQLRS